MLFLALFACSSSQPHVAPKEPPPQPETTVQRKKPKKKRKAKQQVAELHLKQHCSAVVTAWQQFVESGCAVEQMPTPRLATTLRALRNTPYARDGHPFKDKNLTTFFTHSVVGCNGKPWYKANTPATLSDAELQCVKRLSVAERAAQNHHHSEALQAALLSKAGQGLEDDISRMIGSPSKEYSLKLDPPTTPGQIGLTFDYLSREEDGTTWESAIVVTCEGEDCTVLHAG